MKILDVPQSGSMAGSTSSRNRFGQYRRTRAIPVNPKSTAQRSVRAVLTDASRSWRALTDAQRAAWGVAGGALTRRDSLGQAITLTGHQFYVSAYCKQVVSGLTPLSTPPATVKALIPILTSLTVASGTVTLTALEIPTNNAVLVYSTPPLSAGRSYTGARRLIQVIPAGTAAAHAVYASFVAKWGAPLAGSKASFEAQLVSGGHVLEVVESSGVVLT